MCNKERIYILKRKFQAWGYSILFVLFRIFPIQRDKIVFSSFEGGGYSCNPKYIAEELQRRIPGKWKLFWFVNDMDKLFPKYVHKIKNIPICRAYHMTTAKIWVDNSRQKYGTLKRKGQMYIQTWHGQVGFKPIGELRGEAFSQIGRIVSRYDAGLIDIWLSNSRWSTEVFTKAFYGENIVKTGSPRNDILVDGLRREAIYDIVRKKLKLDSKTRILLYAPTFRGGSQKVKRVVEENLPDINFDGIKAALEGKTGEHWRILLRSHPQIALKGERENTVKRDIPVVDVSDYDDMAELLAAADAYVTDYSSAAFDVMLAYTPVFLFMNDCEEYSRDRGKMLWDMEELPFSVAHDSEELIKNIKQFDKKIYRKAICAMIQQLDMLEDGKASIRVVDLIMDYLQDEGKI